MLPAELFLNHGGALASVALSLSKKQPYSQKLLMEVPVTFIVFVLFQESNGPSDAYAAISNADRLQAEPESLRKWREEQRERLEVLGNTERITIPYFPDCIFLWRFPIRLLNAPPSPVSTDKNSRKQEAEWKEKAKVELEEWHARQNEQLEKTKTNNRYWFC